MDRDWPVRGGKAWVRHLSEAALPEMRKLQLDFAETISMAALIEDHIRVIEVLDSPQVLRMANYAGRILPPYASSLAKAITAYQTPQQVAVLLQIFGTYRFTENTIIEPRLIQADLAKVREQGYAVDDEETVIGGLCIGAPVRDADGDVIAAVSISQAKQRLTPELRELLPGTLIESSARISAVLGYRPSPAR
jgi:IclR family acetate operon transcriptional repressor